MPKTPPLIIPTNLPGNWTARAKVNKKNKPNIFAAQNKQISFNTNDELHYLSSPSYNGYPSVTNGSLTDQQRQQGSVAPSKHPVPSFEERVLEATSPIFEGPKINKQCDPILYTPNHNSSQLTQSSHMNGNQQQKHLTENQQQQNNEQPTSLPVLASTNMIIDGGFEGTGTQNKEQRINIEDETGRSTEQLESLSFASQDLGEEFQKYMEEYRQIKKEIEDKKRELWLYTEDRMNYLDQRQAYFQKQLKILRGYL